MTHSHDVNDGLSIPEYLCRQCHPELSFPRNAPVEPIPDLIDQEQRAKRAAINAAREEKKKRSLALLRDRHKFERWNRKLKIWQRDDRKIAAEQKREFENGL